MTEKKAHEILNFMGKGDKKGVSGHGELMTADEFRSAISALGFSQQGFAARVGASGRTGQKWALGETRIPGSVAVLLRLLLARPELIPVLDDVSPPPTPRKRGK